MPARSADPPPRPAGGAAIRAVLFDAAGTLIRPREEPGVVYARAASRQGVCLSPWRLGDAFRRVLASAPPMAFPDAPPEARPDLERRWWRARMREVLRAADSARRIPDFDAFFDEVFGFYADPSAWEALPGAREVPEALRERGLRTAVLSNFDHRLRHILEGLRLAPAFDAVVLPAQTGFAKPDPRAFGAAAAALGLPASVCACVGDDPELDLRGARNAGLVPLPLLPPASLGDLPDALLALGALERSR